MKKMLFALVGIAVLIGIVGTGASASAISARSGDSVTVKSGETVNSSLYVAGSSLTIAGNVEGDVYCAGDNIIISGTVNGDVLCAGNNLQIDGTVNGDIRVAGSAVSISGQVKGAATIASQSFTLKDKAAIENDLTLFSEVATLAGTVGRDVVSSATQLIISGTVTRDTLSNDAQLTIEETARLGGHLSYSSEQPAEIKTGASVAGKTQHTALTDSPSSFATSVYNALYWFGALLLLGLVGVLAAPRALTKTTQVMRRKPFVTLGVGLAVMFLTPALFVVLLFTVIGIPLAVMVLLLWLIALFTAFVVTGYAVGSQLTAKLTDRRWSAVVSLISGLFVLVALSLVPYIGGFVGFLAIVWGLGAQTLALATKDTAPKKRITKTTKTAKA